MLQVDLWCWVTRLKRLTLVRCRMRRWGEAEMNLLQAQKFLHVWRALNSVGVLGADISVHFLMQRLFTQLLQPLLTICRIEVFMKHPKPPK